MSTFRERKAARIAAGQRKFTFRVLAVKHAGCGADVEVARPFGSQREAMVVAYGQLSSGARDTAAMRECNRRGIGEVSHFDVVRQDEATGERIPLREEWVPRQDSGFVPSDNAFVPSLGW